MRKPRGSTPPKPYAEMTDDEFRKAVKDEFRFDPLPVDRPKVRIEPYTGTAKLLEQLREDSKKAKSGDLVRSKVLWLAEAAAGFSPKMSTLLAIDHEILVRVNRGAKFGQEQTEKQRGEKRAAALHSRWQQMANEIWAKNRSLTNFAVGKRIAEKLGGNAGTIRKVIVKPK
jgi:hypothetical protein